MSSCLISCNIKVMNTLMNTSANYISLNIRKWLITLLLYFHLIKKNNNAGLSLVVFLHPNIDKNTFLIMFDFLNLELFVKKFF